MRVLALILTLALGAGMLAGCESTFDKAARARAEAGDIAQVTSVDMRQMNGITAEPLAVIPSADGTAAAVVVKITADPGVSVLWAPIEVRVLDAAGKEVGTNNIPGALPILIHLSSAVGGATAYYVNDQILLSGTPASATALVAGKPFTGKLLGDLQTTPVKVTADPSFGDTWTTTITNTTTVRQEQVIVQVIVRDGDKIVGAGTANIEGLEPGASADVTGYFIGSSKGEIELFAPSSNADAGAGAPAAGAADGSTTGASTSGADPAGTTSADVPTMTLQVG
ncbi:MAG: hypothetical protein ACR2J9_09525 [Gaiellales bacterium]